MLFLKTFEGTQIATVTVVPESSSNWFTYQTFEYFDTACSTALKLTKYGLTFSPFYANIFCRKSNPLLKKEAVLLTTVQEGKIILRRKIHYVSNTFNIGECCNITC